MISFKIETSSARGFTSSTFQPLKDERLRKVKRNEWSIYQRHGTSTVISRKWERYLHILNFVLLVVNGEYSVSCMRLHSSSDNGSILDTSFKILPDLSTAMLSKETRLPHAKTLDCSCCAIASTVFTAWLHGGMATSNCQERKEAYYSMFSWLKGVCIYAERIIK